MQQQGWRLSSSYRGSRSKSKLNQAVITSNGFWRLKSAWPGWKQNLRLQQQRQPSQFPQSS